jgi:hypothetical protein
MIRTNWEIRTELGVTRGEVLKQKCWRGLGRSSMLKETGGRTW